MYNKMIKEYQEHLNKTIKQFNNDNADSDHQKGYLEATKEHLRVLNNIVEKHQKHQYMGLEEEPTVEGTIFNVLKNESDLSEEKIEYISNHIVDMLTGLFEQQIQKDFKDIKM